MGIETTLTIAELARFIGQQVQYEYYAMFEKPVSWEQVQGELTTELFHAIAIAPDLYRNIRPVLRPISALSEGEAKECFRRAFPNDRDPDLTVKCDGIEWIIGTPYHILRIYNTGYVSAENNVLFAKKAAFVLTAVIDYLDQQGIDCRGLIHQGKAVEKKEAGETV